MGNGEHVDYRQLGRTGLELSTIGFGAFKIGRNQKIKYDQHYDLPSDEQVAQLIDGLLAEGVNFIDTAPAYGSSEHRIGEYLAAHPGVREHIVLSSKVGETFENGESIYDFSPAAVASSIERSLERLKTDILDIVLIHSDGRDDWIQNESGAVEALQAAKERGLVRAIGMSGKTAEGHRLALKWADALMVEYHLEDRSHEAVIDEARERGVGVLVKKGLASGKLSPEDAIKFVLATSGVTSLVVGSLNLDHLKQNIAAASGI